MNAYEPFPSEVLTGPWILRGAYRVTNYLCENKGKTNRHGLDRKYFDGLWNPLIPKHNALVAKPCPAKSRIIPNQRGKSKKAKGRTTKGPG
jgi:hypothetical protein